MSTARYNTLRFGLPNVDKPPLGFSVRSDGHLSTVREWASIRQAIFILLCTRPGERVMLPDYGCDIHQLAFAPKDDTTAGMAIHFVRVAILKWEPRVELMRVDADWRDDDDGRLDILVQYRVRGSSQIDEWSMGFSPDGGTS